MIDLDPLLRPRSLTLAALLTAVVASPLAAQLTWTADTSQPRPAPGDGYRMVATSSGLILFGGYPNPTTWRYDQGTWTRLTPAHQPSVRRDFAMAYDRLHDRVVLFGGLDWNQPVLLDETWLFDGVDWTRATPVNHPSARERTAMAFDGGTNRIVLFGGSDANRRPLDDTWVWTGSDWQELQTTWDPGPRARHALAETGQGTLLLFGGTDPFGVLDDTWELQGATWSRIPMTSRPPARIGHSMSYDAARGRVVLHGGYAATVDFRADTWEYTGGQWIETTPMVPGPEVGDHASAYDPVSQNVLVFGGAVSQQVPGGGVVRVSTDHFARYSATAQGEFTQLTTSYCGAIRQIQLRGGPPLVGNAQLHLLATASPVFFNKPFVLLLATGFSPTPLSLGTCDLHLNGTIAPVSSDSIIQGSFPLPIPNDRALSGAQLYLQATGPADGPFAGFQGFGLSPTYRITVGD